MFKPLDNSIYFIFEDDVTSTKFVNKAASGILIAGTAGDQSNVPRCGTAVMVGPNCDTVQPGDYILVDHGKWTTSFEANGLKMWKTDEDCVLAISEEPILNY